MKKLTLEQFKSLVANGKWQRQNDHEIIDRTLLGRETPDDTGENTLLEYWYLYGWASVTSELDGIIITYTEGFNYEENQPETFSASTEGQEDVWKVEGCTVVDEDGDEIDIAELTDYLSNDFKATDYSDIQIEEILNIDVDENSDMETFTLENDNAPSLRFTGQLIAQTSSSSDKASGSNYSGQTGRWTTLALYKTIGGKYICHQVGHTQWAGERTRYTAEVCDSIQAVIAFFGHRWLAKDLYAEAGIEDVKVVD